MSEKKSTSDTGAPTNAPTQAPARPPYQPPRPTAADNKRLAEYAKRMLEDRQRADAEARARARAEAKAAAEEQAFIEMARCSSEMPTALDMLPSCKCRRCGYWDYGDSETGQLCERCIECRA
jgi:hypothetical protein